MIAETSILEILPRPPRTTRRITKTVKCNPSADDILVTSNKREPPNAANADPIPNVIADTYLMLIPDNCADVLSIATARIMIPKLERDKKISSKLINMMTIKKRSNLVDESVIDPICNGVR